MRVSVLGLWHLGSVTASCLASVGHEVVGIEEDRNIIEALKQGKAPIFEPGLNELIKAGLAGGNLHFTSEKGEGLKDSKILWIAFDTPVDEDDRADVDFVLNQIKNTLPFLADGTVVLISSQIPAGSVHELEGFVRDKFPGKRVTFAYSPENLRLGKALDVFLKPDRIVVGIRDAESRKIIEGLLSPITDRIEWMSVESAEMTKHAINAFLAISVTFANELASICESVGADAYEVERGLKTEVRIGPKAYLSPGGPFSGGTLARDIAFLEQLSKTNQLESPVIHAVKSSNDGHKKWVRRKFTENFNHLKGKTIAVWGLTYKPGTDTLRRSLAVELCDWLIEQGAIIHVFDPVVKNLPERWSGMAVNAACAQEAVAGADALVVGTDWPEFKKEAEYLKDSARPQLVIIDPNRHLYAVVSGFGFKYVAVGTPR